MSRFGSLRRLSLLACTVLGAACSEGADLQPQTPEEWTVRRVARFTLPRSDEGVALPTTTGLYLGRYLVPAATELADAAVYTVDHVEWEVEGDQVELSYDLPVGLVGGDIPVALTGALDAGHTRLPLAGAVATGSCTGATPTQVSCREEFFGLGPLPIDMGVVSAAATAEYAGAVSDREEVARIFGSDPIGIVEIDFSTPVVDPDDGEDDDDDSGQRRGGRDDA